MVDSGAGVFRHVFPGDFRLERRKFRVFLREIVIQENGRRKVDGFIESHVAAVVAFQDFYHLAALALIGHVKTGVLIFAEEFHQFLLKLFRLTGIGVPVLALADSGEFLRRRVQTERVLKFVLGLKRQIYLVREILHSDVAPAIRRQDVNIEVAFRLRRTAFPRQAHKEIAFPENIVGIPVQVVFVNLKAGDILLRFPFQAVVHRFIEITVELSVSHNGGFLLDFFVVINDLIHVNVILVIGIVMDDKLPGNCGHDSFECGFYRAQEKIGVLLWNWKEQAEVIFQIFGGQSKLNVQAVCGQTMNGKRVNDSDSQRLVGRTGKGAVDNFL